MGVTGRKASRAGVASIVAAIVEVTAALIYDVGATAGDDAAVETAWRDSRVPGGVRVG